MKKTMFSGFFPGTFQPAGFLNQIACSFALLLGLLLSNCTKEAVVSPGAEKLDPSNPANPFDYVGQQHNEALKYIFNDHAGKVAALQNDAFALQNLYFELSTQFALKQGYADVKAFSPDHYLKCMTRQPDGLLVEQNYQDYAACLSSIDLPPHLRPWVEKFYALLSAYPVENAGSLPGLFKAIRAFEAEAMATLGTEESAILLIAASTARYSAAYWNDKKGFGGPQLFGWGESFFADALGAGVGAAAGAATGAAAGGAPSVPGAVIGGLIGGAVASAAFAG